MRFERLASIIISLASLLLRAGIMTIILLVAKACFVRFVQESTGGLLASTLGSRVPRTLDYADRFVRQAHRSMTAFVEG